MWVIVEDIKVRHLWECPGCGNRVYVEPCFYSEMGEPVCTECDCEWEDIMEYIHTEINNEGAN